jgi:hypothetical protein
MEAGATHFAPPDLPPMRDTAILASRRPGSSWRSDRSVGTIENAMTPKA